MLFGRYVVKPPIGVVSVYVPIEKGKFTLFSNHNRSLLRRQPRAYVANAGKSVALGMCSWNEVQLACLSVALTALCTGIICLVIMWQWTISFLA